MIAGGSSAYTLATGEAGAARLRLLDEVYGASAKALMTELGLSEGMSSADIGCGIGTLSRWMAGQVGAKGSVVGVDISTEQLDVARREAARMGYTHLRFQQADAYDTGLNRESFDMVYCRFLLCHLQHPAKALHEMGALLKPAGVMLCDEVDVASIFADPPSAAVDRMRELMLAVGTSRSVDYCLGNRLHRLFRAEGFGDPQVRIDQPVYATGEAKRFWEYTLLEAAPVIIRAGLATPGEMQELRRGLATVAEDPTIMVAQARKVQVWARKTQAGGSSVA